MCIFLPYFFVSMLPKGEINWWNKQFTLWCLQCTTAWHHYTHISHNGDWWWFYMLPAPIPTYRYITINHDIRLSIRSTIIMKTWQSYCFQFNK